jgi:hypothetical protein
MAMPTDEEWDATLQVGCVWDDKPMAAVSATGDTASWQIQSPAQQW